MILPSSLETLKFDGKPSKSSGEKRADFVGQAVRGPTDARRGNRAGRVANSHRNSRAAWASLVAYRSDANPPRKIARSPAENDTERNGFG